MSRTPWVVALKWTRSMMPSSSRLCLAMSRSREVTSSPTLVVTLRMTDQTGSSGLPPPLPEPVDYPFVVNNFVVGVEGGAIGFDRPLQGLDGHVHARTEPARSGQNDPHSSLTG